MKAKKRKKSGDKKLKKMKKHLAENYWKNT